MAEYNFEPPSDDEFHRHLVQGLESSGHHDLVRMLAGCRSEICPDGSFGRRWQALSYTFRIRVPFDRLTKFNAKHRDAIETLVNQLMPAAVGYDLSSVEFAPFAIGQGAAPPDKLLSETVKPDHDHVKAAWTKALSRRDSDPEGAITSARTLLEAVCKVILDENGVTYDPGLELPKLYRETAKTLNLAPEQHQEQVFKQILSGVFSVLDGLGAIRNSLSDAHGRGKRVVRPQPRHAELAVNLACSVSSFLMRTHEKRQAEKPF